MNEIEWTRKATKQLMKLPRTDRANVVTGVDALEDLSTARNVKALTHHQYGYRLRVGRYRVFFEFADSVKIVTIEEVKKRDDRTY